MRLPRALRRALASKAALAPLYYAAVATLATLLAPPTYSSTEHTMSQLAAPEMPNRDLMNAGFAGYGVLVQGLGPLLHHEAGGGRRGRMLWGLVALYGLGAMLAAKYPTNSETEVLPGISEDTAHDAAGVMTFASIMSLMAVAPGALRERPAWNGWWSWFSYAMFGATCTLSAPFYSRMWPLKRGLLQRGFFVTTMTWILVTALRLRKLS